MDDYLNFQFILSSCGCIGSKFKVVVGLPLPGRTNPFVPVLYNTSLVALGRASFHRFNYK